MAEMRFKKDSEEFKIVNEFLLILQRYYLPEEKDEYWESLLKELNDYYKKYDTKLARGLAKFAMNYLDEKYREAKENGRL